MTEHSPRRRIRTRRQEIPAPRVDPDFAAEELKIHFVARGSERRPGSLTQTVLTETQRYNGCLYIEWLFGLRDDYPATSQRHPVVFARNMFAEWCLKYGFTDLRGQQEDWYPTVAQQVAYRLRQQQQERNRP